MARSVMCVDALCLGLTKVGASTQLSLGGEGEAFSGGSPAPRGGRSQGHRSSVTECFQTDVNEA